MGRERVPQLVRRYPPSDAGLERISVDQLPECLSGERSCPAANEQGGAGASLQQGGTRPGEVLTNALGGELADWNQALLSSLACREQVPGLEVEIVDRQSNQLADAQPGGVEQPEHCRVAGS